MLKRLLIALLIIIIIAAVGVGLYFAFRDNSGPNNIELDRKYYLNSIRNGLYQYPVPGGTVGSGEPFIDMKTKDHSHCVFEDNYRIFKLNFMTSSAEDVENNTELEFVEFAFVVTDYKATKDGIRATIRHIYQGEIVAYHLYTNGTQIIMQSTVRYQIMVASEEYELVQPQWITRSDTMVIKFGLSDPAYIRKEDA